MARLEQMKFFTFYNNCITYVMEQQEQRKDEDPIRDILVPALQPQLITMSEENNTTTTGNNTNLYF